MATVTLWLLIAAGVLVGAFLGGAIALLVLRRSGGGAGDVNALKGELDDYRREVAEHYVETAKRVDALTHAYKAVYDHLEDGAYRLVGEQELRARLEDADSEPVTIEGIGQRVLQRPEDDRRASGPGSEAASGDAEPRGRAGEDGPAGRDDASDDAAADGDRVHSDDGSERRT